jgi:hypothetical protein
VRLCSLYPGAGRGDHSRSLKSNSRRSVSCLCHLSTHVPNIPAEAPGRGCISMCSHLDFVHCFIRNKQSWQSDRGSSEGRKAHQDQEVMRKKRSSPGSAVEPLPADHERSRCVYVIRLRAREGCLPQDEACAHRARPGCRDRRAWASCGQWPGRPRVLGLNPQIGPALLDRCVQTPPFQKGSHDPTKRVQCRFPRNVLLAHTRPG